MAKATNESTQLSKLFAKRRWNGEGTAAPRAWYIDVPEAQREPELAFLKTEIYRGEIDLLVRRIDAYDRFSDRV